LTLPCTKFIIIQPEIFLKKGKTLTHSTTGTEEGISQQIEVARHYDRVWQEQNEKIGESWESWPFFRMKPSVHLAGLDALGNILDKKVLDLACGAGYSALELVERGAQVMALDLSEQGLDITLKRIAKNGYEGKAQAVRASVEQLPFADESFDFVFAQNFLMHVSAEKVGREVWRVLKPGGRAVFIEPLSHHPLVKLYRALFSAYKGTRPRWCTREDIQALSVPFKKVENGDFYFLTALASVGFVQSRGWLLKPTWAVLNGLDTVLGKIIPHTRRMRWVCLAKLDK
jgi:SAM-dependent methyltransferase